MKKINFLVFFSLFLVFFTQNLLKAQTVVKVKDPYLLIRVDDNTGVNKGDIFYIYRLSDRGKPIVVAKVSVVAVRKDMCAVKVLKKSKKLSILPGDLIKKADKSISRIDDSVSYEQTGTEESASGQSSISTNIVNPSFNRTLSYVAFSAGVAVSALGYYFYDQAGLTASQKPATMDEYYNLQTLTYKYDKRANYCFYVGGGLIAFSIINYLIINHKANRLNSAYIFTPVSRPGYSGISFSVPLSNDKVKG